MASHEEMLSYVEAFLTKHQALKSGVKATFSFRNRFDHTKRVYNWAKIIMSDYPSCNQEVLLTAAIFHDIGYANAKLDHAKYGAVYFLEYAKSQKLDDELTKKVAYLIANHSTKNLIKDKNTPIELVLLMEADLLDEEGCLGITWDLMAVGMMTPNSYQEGYQHLYDHSAHILEQDYMITLLAQKFWKEKQEFVRYFMETLAADLFMEDKID